MSIYDLVQEIRQHINSPRKQHILIKNTVLWHQLCSSMDVIEDTQLAIEAYVNKDFNKNAIYLAVYGLLQALFLQQDAVRHLKESLGLGDVDFARYPNLQTTRDIRNNAIGHPTKRGGVKKSVSHHRISRPTLNCERFQLLSYFNGGAMKFKEISITKCISDQENDIASILLSVAKALKQEKIAHREQFMNKKLEDAFPKITHYYFEKIYESTSNPQKYPPDLGLTHLNLIRKSISDFQESLAKRDIELETYPGIKDTHEQINYCLHRLEEYLQMLKAGIADKRMVFNEKDACIYWEHARQHFNKLIQMAHEIDEDYAKDL